VDLVVASLADRPELAALVDEFPGAWPEFMFHDIVSSRLYDYVVNANLETCLVAIDAERPDRLAAKACALPFGWLDDTDNDLPPDGYDAVLLGAAAVRFSGRRGDLLAGVEVTVQSDLRGYGISALMLQHMRDTAGRLGFTSLVVPVRPNRKHEHPDVPMAEYAAWTRDDGLPVDPWLRVHVRAGARIVGVAPRSMTVVGSLSEWRTWTGLPFDTTGPVYVPGALVPVICDTTLDRAVYVEPNVWVHHRL
jgi:GNAT superfamily N-acetyltransferase